jgi:hypothetical protein
MKSFANLKELTNHKFKSPESILFCTFATSSFSRSANFLRNHVEKLGADYMIIANMDDLGENFRKFNVDTLRLPRGSGYWIWKSYVLNTITTHVPDNVIVFYLDAGAIPKLSLSDIRKLTLNEKINLWHEGTDFGLNKHWCDYSVWKLMNASDSGYFSNHYWAGAVLARNSNQFRAITSEWLKFCQIPRLLRPDSDSKYEPTGDTIWHRHDQSILNAIVAKNPRFFWLHESKDEEYAYNESFYHHRRGYIDSNFDLKLFYLSRFIYYKIKAILPKNLEFQISHLIERSKGRTSVSESELARHKLKMSED